MLNASTLAACFSSVRSEILITDVHPVMLRSLYHSLLSLHSDCGIQLAALNEAAFCWARCESLEMALL